MVSVRLNLNGLCMENDLQLENDIIQFLRFLREEHPVKYMAFLLGIGAMATHLKAEKDVNSSKIPGRLAYQD